MPNLLEYIKKYCVVSLSNRDSFINCYCHIESIWAARASAVIYRCQLGARGAGISILSGLKAGLDSEFKNFRLGGMEKQRFFIRDIHDIHPKAIEVCQILQQHGYQAYIVGGCVRDMLMHGIPKDWDICTDASPEKVLEIFPKTIPTGLQHGTVTICMGEGVENHFEVTTFRVEGKYTDGRRPEEVRFVTKVEEDLARRDLTINAIAYDPISKKYVDPFGGTQDIEAGIIRAVGIPLERFQEDGLRIMRVARFASRFGYLIDPATLQGIKDSLDTLKKVSKERINDELCKTLTSYQPSYGLSILKDSGVLDIICPLLMGRQLAEISLQDQCHGEMETRLALMYHKMPPMITQCELEGLKFSNKSIKRIMFLIGRLDAFATLQQIESHMTYRHFIAWFMNEAPDPWEDTLSEFIQLTKALGLSAKQLLDKYQGETVYARSELVINGNDLMSIGLKPGPEFKRILDECYAEILERPEHNNKEFLLEYAITIS